MLRNIVISVFALLVIDVASIVSIEPKWMTLRVTYGLNLLNSNYFAEIPRTEAAAKSKGWARIPGECSGGKFLGARYIKSNDTGTIVLYDKNGFVAGLQQGFSKKDVDRVNSSYNFAKSTAYQLDTFNGAEVYFLTAYFVQPSIICSKGRTAKEYEEQGTGSGVYLQNGTNPTGDSVQIPMYEKEMNSSRHWVKGGCMKSMGQHYWYDISEHMSCNNTFPFGIIYNRGKLTSFFFATLGFFEFSKRLEHPPKFSLSLFFKRPVPQCIKDEYKISGGVSTMHVFFNVLPWNLLC